MRHFLENRIEGTIEADELILGKGVVVEKGVVIRGKSGPAKKVRLGDFSFIGKDSVILTPHFELGDYTKLHAHAFVHGEKPALIGRNCWIGGNVILDSMGGLEIEDNVGIGAQSQIWTHMQFGDIVEGCRFFSKKSMRIGKDAWLVGHCIVSPVEIGERSMALVGSVVTKDMLPNRVYAGVPAKDVTDKMGSQFEDRTAEQKKMALEGMLEEFFLESPQYRGQLRACVSFPTQVSPDVTYFNVTDRTYNKLLTEAEVSFLKAKVPLVKFVPR